MENSLAWKTWHLKMSYNRRFNYSKTANYKKYVCSSWSQIVIAKNKVAEDGNLFFLVETHAPI